MTTALSIISRSAELIGYKDPDETLNGNDSANFLGVLNDLVDAWNVERLYIVTVAETTASVSASPATIGAGQTINVTRPVRLEPGCFTRVGGVDYPLHIMTRAQYNAIPLKSTTSDIPEAVYYDAGLATGNLYLYPAPSGAVSLHLQMATQLSAFADLATDYSFAPGYKRALEYSLAEELAPGRRPLDPQIARIAANARRSIRRVNLEIPDMDTSSYLTPLARIQAGV
jgi:hypothetical protein